MDPIHCVIEKYKNILSQNLTSHYSKNRLILGKKGIPNRLFLFHLCQDREVYLTFLRDCGLLKSNFKCQKCNGEMKLRVKKSLSDGMIWVCRKNINGKECGSTKSLRYGSLFKCSRLTLEEVLFLVYEIIWEVRSDVILKEYSFSTNTLSMWRQFIYEQILEYIELTSQKIGGNGKTVEVNESKFGKRKFHRGHPDEEQWVLGGVEIGSGKVFLVPILDRSKETLVDLIKEWIEPSTTIYPNCWSPNSLGEEGYNHLTNDHYITFVDSAVGCTKNSLATRNRQGAFKFYFAMYLFKKSCEEQKIDCYNKFLEIVREVNWEDFEISI